MFLFGLDKLYARMMSTTMDHGPALGALDESKRSVTMPAGSVAVVAAAVAPVAPVAPVSKHGINMADLAVPVFAFYLLVACNFLPQLVGCRLQAILQNSMLAKHVIAIILLFFLVVTVNPNLTSAGYLRATVVTAVVYAWFFATTRSALPVVLMTVLLLLVVYVLSLVKTQSEAAKDDETAKRCETAQKWIALASAILSLVGFIAYFIAKRAEYGPVFSLSQFTTGTILCRGTDLPVGVSRNSGPQQTSATNNSRNAASTNSRNVRNGR